MFQESGLNLGGGQTVTRHVDDIINTTTDPVVSVVVTASTITGEIITLINVQISIHIALVSAPDGTGHARPWLLESQHTLDVIAEDLLARHWVNDGRLNAEERQGRTARLRGRDTAQGSDHVRAGFGLPVSL